MYKLCVHRVTILIVAVLCSNSHDDIDVKTTDREEKF